VAEVEVVWGTAFGALSGPAMTPLAGWEFAAAIFDPQLMQ
jgi:hypothetical protein